MAGNERPPRGFSSARPAAVGRAVLSSLSKTKLTPPGECGFCDMAFGDDGHCAEGISGAV
jgi:hypothetical protein